MIPELLDEDRGSPQEVTQSLADLRLVNRYFGGVRVTLRLVKEVTRRLGCNTLSLLDIASGSGDVPLAVQRALAPQGMRVEVTVTDRNLMHLQTVPVELSAPLDRRQLVRDDTYEFGWPVRRIVADALKLPFTDDSFDIVTCSLFAHHLEPDSIVAFTNEALRVCRTAVLINDLRRSAASLALVYAGLPLFRSRLTRHDGPASVRRAYSIEEMRSLLEKTSAREVGITPRYLFRMGVIAWKSPRRRFNARRELPECCPGQGRT